MTECACDSWARTMDEVVDPVATLILLVVLGFAIWRQKKIMRLVAKALSRGRGPSSP